MNEVNGAVMAVSAEADPEEVLAAEAADLADAGEIPESEVADRAVALVAEADRVVALVAEVDRVVALVAEEAGIRVPS